VRPYWSPQSSLPRLNDSLVAKSVTDATAQLYRRYLGDSEIERLIVAVEQRADDRNLCASALLFNLSPYERDYRWLTQVYESVKPPSGNGKLLWHALGAKTVELINQNVHVESVRDDVETLVMDAQVLEEILKNAEPGKKAREIEIKIVARLRKHAGR
jgi:hypothetical protein